MREIAHVERLRRLEVCVVAPALEEGWRRGFFVAKGRVVCARPYSPLEVRSALAEVERAERSLAPEHADELLLVGQFLRRPPPELEVVPLAHLRRWTSSANGRAA